MPLSGGAAFRGEPVRNAVQLAIDHANAAGGILGSPVLLQSYDDAGETPSGQDPQRGAANAASIIADPETIAMIGPWGSAVGTT